MSPRRSKPLRSSSPQSRTFSFALQAGWSCWKISRRSDPAKQGEILGVNQSASALARILGPMVAITLFYVLPSHILPYLVGAGLMGIALLFSLRIGHD